MRMAQCYQTTKITFKAPPPHKIYIIVSMKLLRASMIDVVCLH